MKEKEKSTEEPDKNKLNQRQPLISHEQGSTASHSTAAYARYA